MSVIVMLLFRLARPLPSLFDVSEVFVLQQVLEDIFTVSGIEIPQFGQLQLHTPLVAFWGLVIIHVVI